MSATVIASGESPLDLSAEVIRAGVDVVVVVTGGDRPHLGAVAAAEPRPSLDDPDVQSSTVSSLAYLGHKDDEIARHMARRMASALGVKVAVAAGAHWDVLRPKEIAQVMANAERLTALIIASLETAMLEGQ